MKVISRETEIKKQILKRPWLRYSIPLFIIGTWTLFIRSVHPNIDLIVMAMSYLMLNVILVILFGQGPSLVSNIFSILCFDYFFTPPFFSLKTVQAKYVDTFLVMFAVTILINRLTVQSRRSALKALSSEVEAERERLMSALLSSVSHDLRTPLTSISGAASILLEQEKKVSAEDRKHLLETINDESIRLSRFVEKILQITKIESGNIHVRKELRSVEEIVGSVLNRMDPLLVGRKITTDIPSDLSAPLDDLLIEQVLVNLLENAGRYSAVGSPIDIRAFQDENWAVVEISDRGPGIPKLEQNHIFEKFYRSDKRDRSGTGLGLAICQGILKVHRGQIGVKDREGGGSIFYFKLPLEE